MLFARVLFVVYLNLVMRRKLTMKKLLYVLSLLIIASMMLAACGGSQVPAATEAPGCHRSACRY